MSNVETALVDTAFVDVVTLGGVLTNTTHALVQKTHELQQRINGLEAQLQAVQDPIVDTSESHVRQIVGHAPEIILSDGRRYQFPDSCLQHFRSPWRNGRFVRYLRELNVWGTMINNRIILEWYKQNESELDKCGFTAEERGDLTVDHLIPILLGGTDSVYNRIIMPRVLNAFFGDYVSPEKEAYVGVENMHVARMCQVYFRTKCVAQYTDIRFDPHFIACPRRAVKRRRPRVNRENRIVRYYNTSRTHTARPSGSPVSTTNAPPCRDESSNSGLVSPNTPPVAIARPCSVDDFIRECRFDPSRSRFFTEPAIISASSD